MDTTQWLIIALILILVVNLFYAIRQVLNSTYEKIVKDTVATVLLLLHQYKGNEGELIAEILTAEEDDEDD